MKSDSWELLKRDLEKCNKCSLARNLKLHSKIFIMMKIISNPHRVLEILMAK